MKELAELWRYREVLLNLVRRNLRVRYKNSVLGFFWSLLNPLMQIGVWYFVFKIVLGNTEPNYMPFLITGFLPWLFFNQTVLDSTACVTQEMPLIKKAYFPRSVLPLSALLSNIVHLGLAFIVLLGLFAIWRVDVNVHYLLVIPATVLIAVFAYGLSAMLAAWSVFYADVKFIVGNLLSLWFFLTPVLYSTGGFLGRTIVTRDWLTRILAGWLPIIKKVYLADPVAVGVLAYRSGLLGGGQNPLVVTSGDTRTPEQAMALQAQLQAQYPFGHYVIAAAVVAILVAIVGHVIFRRLSYLFAERG
jgi:ABC-2 type transport system permease protein